MVWMQKGLLLKSQELSRYSIYLPRTSNADTDICVVVGPDLRLFAAYEHALLKSPYFAKRLRDQFYETSSKKLKLPDMYIDNHISPAFKSRR